MRDYSSIYIISHRGAAKLAPENTLAAIDTGIRWGARFIEIDIHRSRDDVLVVMHDGSVERTTDGAGKIKELSWEEIRRLDAGSWFSSEFRGERVPRLEEIFERMRSHDFNLIVEAKNPWNYPGIEEQLAQLIHSYGIEKRVVVISFYQNWLDAFHQVCDDVAIGSLRLLPGKVEDARNGTRNQARALVIHWLAALLNPFFIRNAHKHGYEIVAWTVDSAPLMRLLYRWGVDGITTNDPATGMKVVEKLR